MYGKEVFGKRTSEHSNRPSRGSNTAGTGPGATDVDFDFVVQRTEQEYPEWWTRKHMLQDFYTLSEDSYWNSFICLMALMGIVWVAVSLKHPVFKVLDIIYNISYAVHVFSLTYSFLTRMEPNDLTFFKALKFLVDMATFSHYVSSDEDFKLLCYYLRLARPFGYLWALNDYNLRGSVLGTTLKFCYIFLVMRVTWALVWLNLDAVEKTYQNMTTRRALQDIENQYNKFNTKDQDSDSSAVKFLTALYLVNKMFVPIGPSVPPANDVERLACLAVMLSGCLVVTAFAVAALSLVVCVYMRPEESFRARYRLIIKEMKESKLPLSQRDKVETFYKMYWHKQRAVSATQLLPTFPPTLPATIFADIYFEATQKSRILQDLSYQFLSELAKKMETIHYIPGDAIIKRLSKKSSYIYVTYGDVEMVTAEDDTTAILRMTRGTGMTPCGVCAPAGLGRAHVEIRAATFCTAHVLDARDMWKVVIKHGRTADESEIILNSFNSHMDQVKLHYQSKLKEEVKHRSSILHFKRCLMGLKEAQDAQGELLLAQTDVFLEIAGTYIMRNRADATLTDESDAICLRPTFPCILQPTSSLQMAWKLFVACFVLCVCFIHPYYLVFKKDVPIEFRFFDYVGTAVYLLDLIVHLSTGANVEEGVAITFRQTSSQQMRSYWFVLDVLGTLPIFELIGTGHFAGINKILRLPKVFRVLKELEDACVYRGNVLRLMSYTLLIVIACYLIAALQQGFMCFEFGYCVVANLTHPPFWANKPLDEETIAERVSFALYWSISMIIFAAHMETWGVENWNNVLYTLFVLEVCIILRIFIEAVYSATIMVTTALREDYDACILIVKNFLIRNQVDPILSMRFISYLQLCWYTDKAYSMTNKRSIFYDLPPHVYQDIVATQRSKYILAIPFMKYISKENLKNISSQARLFYTSPNEILMNTGDMSNEMYVIKQGICEIVCPISQAVVGLLTVKSHFGVIVCLLRIPAFYTIRTVTNVQLFSISRKLIIQAVEQTQIKDAIEYAKTLPEYEALMTRRKPFTSYKVPDPIPNMEQFPLPRKHEHDAAFLNPFYRLGFLSILRYIFPRFTIRPDGQYLLQYEYFRASCAFASAMVFPGYAYLVLQWPWLYYITWLLDISAHFDILQRMLVGYYNDMGILVYHPASTAAYYLKGAFFIDLFGCVAMESLESPQIDIENRYLVTQMGQFLMLNRLLQLYRVPGAMHVLSKFIERRDILLIFKTIPLFMVLLNVLTCFMVLYSVSIYKVVDNDNWQILPFKDQGGSWVELFKSNLRFNLTESPYNLHLATYFWMVYETSTTGYNTFKPSNIIQIRVLFLGMLIGAMLVTYFAVRIISVRAHVNAALAEFQEHMKDMMVYMRRENLSPELQKLVLDYYEYTWDKMGGVDYRMMFKLCHQITLRTDAILHIYGPTFAKCPVLVHSDHSLLRIIGRAVSSAYFLREMEVIKCDDVISDMYFVDYGGVDARETIGDTCTTVRLPRGSIFGNLDGLPTVRCPMLFVATSRVHLLMINSMTFHRIIDDFPAVKKLLKKFRPDHTNSYIMGNAAEATHRLTHQRSLSGTPVLVTNRNGLIKHLYFKDKYIQIYLIIVSLLCVYADAYNAGFQDNSMPLVIALYVLDVCFYLKILLQYTLPVIVDSAAVRKILLPLRKAYFHGHFKYDLLSCIPFELFCFTDKENKWMIFSCLRLNRMFRMVTIYNCLKRHHERLTVNLVLSTASTAFIWFTLFVHITSCVWYFIGTMEEWETPKSSWIYKDDGTSWCDGLYICSMYFVVTTFTQNGVGDIMPKKKSEVIFVCGLQIVSTMIYLIYIGEFSNIIQYQSFRSFSFYSKYLELQDFMKNNRVSRNLVHVVNRYSLHLWRETRGMQAPHFLHTAPQTLKLQIMAAAYLHHLSRHHVFENCEPAFLRQLVGCLQLLTYNEDMYVVKSSEITDAMYLIHTGKIEEIAVERHKVPRIYPAGSYFGVLQGLKHDLPFTHSYRTLIKSQVLTLRRDDWWYLLEHYPNSKEAIKQYKKSNDDDDMKPGGSSDDWPSPKTPKPPKPPRQPKPPLVTELLDKGSPPTPPMKIRERSEAETPKKFTIPEGSKPLEGGRGPETMQPGLYPLKSRDINSNKTTNIIQPVEDGPVVPVVGEHNKNITRATRAEGNKTTQLSSVSQIVLPKYVEEIGESTHLITIVADKAKQLIKKASKKDLHYITPEASEDMLQMQEDDEATAAIIKELDKAGKKGEHKDETELVEKGMLNELLVNTSSSSDDTDERNREKHMFTLNISPSNNNTNETDEIIDYEDANILPYSNSNAIRLLSKRTTPKTDLRTTTETDKKETIKAAMTKYEEDPDDDAVAGTSKALIKMESKEGRVASTPKTRHIRVRYENDGKPREQITDYHENAPQGSANNLSDEQRNLLTLDSDIDVILPATTSSSSDVRNKKNKFKRDKSSNN